MMRHRWDAFVFVSLFFVLPETQSSVGSSRSTPAATDPSVNCHYVQWKKATVCDNGIQSYHKERSKVGAEGIHHGFEIEATRSSWEAPLRSENSALPLLAATVNKHQEEYHPRERWQHPTDDSSQHQQEGGRGDEIDLRAVAAESAESAAASVAVPRHQDSARFCRAMGSPPPPYVAVVARWDENVSWTQGLPMPVLVYEHAKPDAVYSVPENKGSETSSYLQYILDHYDCLPTWTLFLHGHGRTASSGVRHGATRHHPTDPSEVASLVDVKLIGKGFLALGHMSEEDWAHPGYLDGAARRFSSSSSVKGGGGGGGGGAGEGKQRHHHHAAWEPTEKGKKGCQCRTLKKLFPKADCSRPWGWNMGAEFWAKNVRVTARPYEYWQKAMSVAMSGKGFKRFGHAHHTGAAPPSMANEAGYCFESVWHALLGEPFYNFKPAFRLIEDLPRVEFSERCRESSRSERMPQACAGWL